MWTKCRSLISITGASRGIGREIALEMAGRAAADSAFIVTARTAPPLLRLKEDILQRLPTARVFIVTGDMTEVDSAEQKRALDEALEHAMKGAPYETLLLVHNAAFLGDGSRPARELNDAAGWLGFLGANLVSPALFNNAVLRHATQESFTGRRFVVNMSSSLAVEAHASFTQHACGKAAKEAFFRGLAAEESSLRVLNYAPGMVMTDMYKEVQASSFDPSIREAFRASEAVESGRALTPSQTVKRLLDIIDHDSFQSGAHVDYYDEA